MAAPSPITLLRRCAPLLIPAAALALLNSCLHPKCSALTPTARAVAEVTLSEATHWTAPLVWVDARSAKAYQIQHIPGAVLLNEDEWQQLIPNFLETWRPGAKVVVYCDSQACDASQEVARRIQRDLSLSDIYVLKGGWRTWLQAQP